MRLDRSIASQGAYTRSEIRKLIRAGRVTVDGAPVRDSAGAAGYAARHAEHAGIPSC